MTRSFAPLDLHASGRPLSLAAQGFFWSGLEWIETASGPAVRGQTYVEYWIPSDLRHPTPLILVHGGGGQGLEFLGTADARPGWVQWFVSQGHPVYVIDRPGHGRSPHHPDAMGSMGPLPSMAFFEKRFTRPEAWPDQYPTAALHNKWPGTGQPRDPAFDTMMAELGPTMNDMGRHHRDCQRGLIELLQLTGPGILLTHSAGGPAGWLTADARPDLVRAILALEPAGPPFDRRPNGMLDWGITGTPLAFDPPAADPSEIARVICPAPRQGLVDCLIQGAPARQLPGLAQVPVTIFTAEASWASADGHGTVDFLRQAGVKVQHVRLEDHGIHGNGHEMIMETNSDEIAEFVRRWVVASNN